MDGVKRASWRRNEFAYGKILNHSTYRSDESDNSVETERGAFLVAPNYMTMSQRAFYEVWDETDPLSHIPSTYRYTSEDVKSFIDKFQKLDVELFNYMDAAKPHESGLPKNVFRMLQDDAEKLMQARSRRDARLKPP